MPGMLTRVLTVAGAWLLAGVMLYWGRLGGATRRWIALLTSAAGVAFLVVAVRTEGLRETQTMAVFLLGTPSVTDQVSASASLPYYMLTGVCFLLGTVGLAVSDSAAHVLRRRWLASAIGLSVFLTLLRFALEKAAAPASWTYPVGIVWLPPLVGAYFAMCLREEGKGFRSLVLALLAYGFAARGFVAVLALTASLLRLGSHYDVTQFTRVYFPFSEQIHWFDPGSITQVIDLVVLPQLVFWPLFTLVFGLIGAGIAGLIRGPRATEAFGQVGLAD
jgi:hypothetical protein